jgi:uncharacterized membrane-anchored protein YitT (DUF2179 family)
MLKRHSWLWEAKNAAMVFIGALITATGLEFFLIPNEVIDGGVIGISIMLSHITGVELGVFTFFLNLPFLYFGYREIGMRFVLTSLFAIASLSVFVTYFHGFASATNDVLLATVYGGIIIGIGVGLIIRYGGSLDGTEIVAIVLNEKTAFSVGQIVMFFNLFILTSAGFVFSWNNAMYSIIAFYIAFKVIDITIEGIDEAKAAYIITSVEAEAVIIEEISTRLGRGVTVMHAEGGFSREQKSVLYSVITRLEIAALRDIIEENDPNAFVTIHDVSDVIGNNRMKKYIN